MADINIYQDDTEDCSDEGDEYGLVNSDYDNQDEGLSPLEKLEKYMQIDNILSRQMVARTLLDTLRAVADDQDEADGVLKAVARLSVDPGASVRSELMEQIPHIAAFCQERCDTYLDAMANYLLPIVVQYLTDTNNQVRKTSQAALLVLLEQELVERDEVEKQICPVVLELTNSETLDVYRTEAVALLSKMAPLVGKDITERIFLPQFTTLCTDTLFHVRKVCAANFGDLCSVVGMSATEEHLLPKFVQLCEDGVWGVRKACAECFSAVSFSCSLDTRKSQLASLFTNLLCDQSRWVRIAAFEALGPFISTFANPVQTGLYFDDDGVLCYRRPDRSRSQTSCESNSDETSHSNSTSSSSDDSTPNHCDAPSSPSRHDGGTSPSPANSPAKRANGITDDDDESSPATRNNATATTTPSSSLPHNNATTTTATTTTQPTTTTTTTSCDNNNDKKDSINIRDPRDTTSVDSMEVDDMVLDSTEKTIIELNLTNALDNGAEIAKDYSVEEKMAENYMSKKSDCDAGEEEDDSVKDSSSMSSRKSSDASSLGASGGTSSFSTEGAAKPKSRTRTLSESSSQSKMSETDPGHVHIHLDNVIDFNEFQYWRVPVPELDIDLDIVDGKASNIQIRAKVRDREHKKIYSSRMTVSVTREGGSGDAVDDDDEDSTLAIMKPLINTHISDSDSYQIRTASVSTVSDATEEVGCMGSTHVLGHLPESVSSSSPSRLDLRNSLSFGDQDLLQLSDISLQDLKTEEELHRERQDIIPFSLLDHYLSMVDPSSAQVQDTFSNMAFEIKFDAWGNIDESWNAQNAQCSTVDTEITRHCAFSFPAVAYTLGREYWPCLRELYRNLAGDMQWKVRRTLAFSIHELAVILGETITSEDLVPIFNEFLKDLDEVKIGAVKHLADFVRLLGGVVRRSYLYRLSDIMATDNNRNWRYRLELCEQLLMFCDLYTPDDLCHYIMPVALSLAADKVSEVRRCAFRLLTLLLCKLSEHEEEQGDDKLLMSLVGDLTEKFAHSTKWYGRQTFAQLCDHLLDGAYDVEKFAVQFLPTLLELTEDPIPNVRIALARTLSHNIMDSDYFTSQSNPHHEELLRALQTLQMDSDRDVRYYSMPHQRHRDDEAADSEGTNQTIPV